MHSDDFKSFEESDDDEPEGSRAGILPESLRKLFVTGMSAVFMTEEGIRNALSEVRLPKDAIAALIQQTDKSRRELMRLLAEEIKRYLRAVDLPGELRKALSGLTIELNAEIRFIDEKSAKTVLKTRISESLKTKKRAKGAGKNAEKSEK